MSDLVFYVDLDGVMADYGAGMTALGYHIDPTLGRQLNQSGTSHPLKREMYERIRGTEFYRNLPLMKGAVEIFNAIADLDPIILTAAPKFGSTEDDFHVNPHWLGAAYHKRHWVEHTLLPACFLAQCEARVEIGSFVTWAKPERLPIPDDHFICTSSARKQEFMHRKHAPVQVLIDDRIANCMAWYEAGGLAIHHEPTQPDHTVSLIALIRASAPSALKPAVIGYAHLPPVEGADWGGPFADLSGKARKVREMRKIRQGETP